MKIVINRQYGGFHLSKEALEWFEKQGVYPDPYGYELERFDPLLVECVEVLGSEKASADGCKLKVVEVPDDIDWYIDAYDGIEWISEAHRTWR